MGLWRRLTKDILAAVLIAVAATPAVAQQNLNWDANGVLPVSGGTGAWNTTSPLWFNGVTFQAWNNATLDNAIFGASAGNVTLAVPITVHDMTFNVGGYLFPSLGTVALAFGGVNPTITTNVGTTQLFPPLTGSTGFTKSGAGTLQINGTSVGYTGVTTVNAGTLAVSNSLALGLSTAASNLVLNNGSTIAFSSPSFNHNYTLTGGIVNLQITNTLVSGSPTLTASTTLNFNGTSTTGSLSGNLADTGANILSVTKSDTGRVVLSGNNSYTGPTTVTRGRLQLNSAGALSPGSNLVFNGAVGTGGSIELTSNFGNFTRGLGAGAGQVQWLGDGGFLSSGSGRSVNIGGAGAMLTWGAGGFVPNGNRLILGTSSNNLLDFQNGIDLSGGVRAVQGDGGLISGHARMNGILSGTGGINQVGNGFLELTGTNTYTGGTVMTSGILVVGSDANLGDAAGTLTFNGGTLENTGAFTTARSVTINAPGGTFRTDANLEASGPIAGTGQLTKTGVATLTLTGTGTYLGGTTISTGTLQIGNGGTTGSILGNIIDNGVLAFNRSDALIYGGAISGAGSLEQRGAGTTILTGTNTNTGGTTISAGTLQIGNGGTTGSLTGNVANGGVLAFNRSNAITFGGIISGAGSVEQNGPGTLILSGANTYLGGTILNGGSLAVATDGNLGAASGVLTFNGGTLENTGAFTTVRSVTINAPGGTFQTDANLVATGLVSGAGQLTKTGAAALTLTGVNTYAGGTVMTSGILVVASDANLGAAAGTLTFNGGTLENTGAFATARNVTINAPGGTFQTDANLVVTGVVGGGGRLTKTGVATLTLTGANTYVGGTTISTGTLQVGNGGTSGSILGDVIDNGILALNRSDTAVFGGAITGAGSLEQRGTGTTVLTGDSTYTGGTTIIAGTLQIGNGGATGSIAGNVNDNGVLAFNRSNAITFGGIISGAGSVEQNGPGTLILSGANTYLGATSLNAGTLSVAADGNLGATSGPLTFNGGTLENTGAFSTARNVVINAPGGTFQTDADLVANGLISGAGQLTKTGGAALTLTGINTYTGGTVVSAGRLIVNGVIVGTTDVLSGGTLQGTGTVGGINVASGGTLAPGAPFGTLDAVGNISFAPGSFFEVKTDPAGVITLLQATGTAAIGGGTVNVVTQDSVFRTGARYTILTAAGGRTGQFDALTQTLPLIDMTLAYGPTSVFLDVARNSTTLCSFASATRNQCATSTTEESLGTDNPLVAAILSLPNLAAIQNALDLVSGEIYASANGALIENSRYVREAVVERVRQTQDSAGTPLTDRAKWGHVFGSFGDRDGDGNAATIDTNIGGFFVGGDAVIADMFRLGLATGYSYSSFNVPQRTSSGSSNDFPLAVYGGTQWEALRLRVGAAYTWHDVEVNRSIVFPGFSDATKADYGARTAQAFGEAGYALSIAGLATEPFAQIAQVGLTTDAFDESGGTAALRLAKNSDEVTYTTLGVRALQTFAGEGNWSATARGILGWRHAFGDTLPLTTNAIGDSSMFVIAGAPIAPDALLVDAGIDVDVADDVTLRFNYSGQIAPAAMENGGWGNLAVRF